VNLLNALGVDLNLEPAPFGLEQHGGTAVVVAQPRLSASVISANAMLASRIGTLISRPSSVASRMSLCASFKAKLGGSYLLEETGPGGDQRCAEAALLSSVARILHRISAAAAAPWPVSPQPPPRRAQGTAARRRPGPVRSPGRTTVSRSIAPLPLLAALTLANRTSVSSLTRSSVAAIWRMHSAATV
jgi:hypothetical protein